MLQARHVVTSSQSAIEVRIKTNLNCSLTADLTVAISALILSRSNSVHFSVWDLDFPLTLAPSTSHGGSMQHSWIRVPALLSGQTIA